jgi:hypothetical protein
MKAATLLSVLLIFMLIFVFPFSVNSAKAQNADDNSGVPQLTNTGNWWQINISTVTVLFPVQAQKPMFLWYYNDNSSEIYCLKYRGLIEYLPLDGYYAPDCEANPQTMQSLMLSRYGSVGGMGMGGMGGMQNFIGNEYQSWVSEFHPSYLPFSTCTWKLAGPSQGIDENNNAYVSFNLTLRNAPPEFDFTKNNISFMCTFYENQRTQQPYGLYSYIIGAGEMDMVMSVSDWNWNSNYMGRFFSSMHHDYGVTVPQQNDSLTLWCDLTSLNMQNLDVALTDANEPSTSVPQNSTLASMGLLEGSSTVSDIIAGGHQIHMQNMAESTTDQLSVPTSAVTPYRMQFAEGDKTLPGFFDFMNHVAVINPTTQQAYSEAASASYRTTDNYMQLFICYHYFGANTLEHDPSIGIDTKAQLIPENLPVVFIVIAVTLVAVFMAITSRRSGTNNSQVLSARFNSNPSLYIRCLKACTRFSNIFQSRIKSG